MSGKPGSVSVVVPTRAGGELLARVVEAVLSQRHDEVPEVLLIDSGSPANELARLRALGARIHSIEPSSFDHGAVRDLAATLAAGEILVFLNQDALPVDDQWLSRITAPFRLAEAPAAVQGGIREFPEAMLAELGRRRFYWDSCGPRFYFTSESAAWIARHGGIGFSTVNCAIARWAWERQPFGSAPILEDKIWQERAGERGWRIDSATEAAVWHTHDYGLRALSRRCASEGFGWRGVGVRYRLGDAMRDVARAHVWREWWRGLWSGEMRRPAEVLFPAVRPSALWWGSRFARSVLH